MLCEITPDGGGEAVPFAVDALVETGVGVLGAAPVGGCEGAAGGAPDMLLEMTPEGGADAT